MELDEIYKNVIQTIETSVGVPKEDIKLEDTLFDKLGVDSIDLVDILFELETLYDVELKISDIEVKARNELKDEPYEIDGVITPEGLTVLRHYMTEVDPKNFVEGITVHEVVQLFTVHSLCKIVEYKLSEKAEEA